MYSTCTDVLYDVVHFECKERIYENILFRYPPNILGIYAEYVIRAGTPFTFSM